MSDVAKSKRREVLRFALIYLAALVVMNVVRSLLQSLAERQHHGAAVSTYIDVALLAVGVVVSGYFVWRMFQLDKMYDADGGAARAESLED